MVGTSRPGDCLLECSVAQLKSQGKAYNDGVLYQVFSL